VFQVFGFDWLFTSAGGAKVAVLVYIPTGEGRKSFVELAWLANDSFGNVTMNQAVGVVSLPILRHAGF
jgi:hypothetical protein